MDKCAAEIAFNDLPLHEAGLDIFSGVDVAR